MHVLSCSVTDIFCAMGIFIKVNLSKIDAFVKTLKSHNSRNIRSAYKKKLDSFYLGHKDHIYVLTILNNCYDHH